MAHRIESFDKQQGLQMAWHGLTEVVPAITLEDNWLTTWDLVPRKIKDADTGEELPWVYLRCSDNPAIRIGQPYNPETFQPVDNRAFLGMIRDSLAGSPHKITSVGSVRNRGRVFVSIELSGMETFKAAGRDFGAYLNFGNGHDKSSVLWANTSNTCTVCDNTFTLNLFQVEDRAQSSKADDLAIRQRHTKNALLKLPVIAQLIDKAVGVQAEFKIALDQINEIGITKVEATNLFAGFLGRDIPKSLRGNGLSKRSFNRVARLGELFETGKGNSGRTLADAFSAVTDYFTHESSGGTNPFRQVLSSEYGTAAEAKLDFYNMIRVPDDVEVMMGAGEELLANTK